MYFQFLKGILMKKNTLSLAIGLLILNSYAPAFAEESNFPPLPNILPQDEHNNDYEEEKTPLQYPPHDGHISYYEDENPPQHNSPHINDLVLFKEQLESFEADDIANIDPNFFGNFDAGDFKHMTPEAMNGFTPEQLNKLIEIP